MTGFVVDLVLRETFFFFIYLWSMLKIVVLLNIFVETLKYAFQDYLMNKKLKRTSFIWKRNLLLYWQSLHFWSI